MNSCPIRCGSVIDARRCSAQAVAGEGETIGGEDVTDGVALVVAPDEPVATGEPDSTAGGVALGLAATQPAAITALSARLSQQVRRRRTTPRGMRFTSGNE